MQYPHSKTVAHVDRYHGVEVADPYRWLEDLDSEETKAWIEAQNQLSFSFLEDIPQRAALKQRLERLWNYEKYGIPSQKGDRYFYFKNDGLQNQNVLYTLASLDGEPEVLLDPNTFSEDGTIALSGLAIDESATWIAYAVSDGGSDWKEWRVKNIETGEELPDRVRWSKFSGASWTHDSQGFFYSRYDEPDKALAESNYYQKLYYHRIGTDASEDTLVYQRSDRKEWGFNGQVTEDGRFLIISVWKGTERKNLVFYKDLTDEKAEVVEAIAEFEARYHFIGNEGELFWFQTDLDAPNGRIVSLDMGSGKRQELVPEAADKLESASLVGDRFIVQYLKDACSQVILFDLSGRRQGEIALPGMGSTSGFGGKRTDTKTFYSFTNFTTPPCIYHYDIATGESTLYRKPPVDFDPSEYETKQIFYTSKDGTRVPLFLAYKKGLELDGDRPTYLYGYGGFNISLTPSFAASDLVWLERGGILAVANLRGGGEYGEQWHEAGMKANKQNVFDDFIAAGEWLIEHRYTRPQKLAIAGGSNGGLLVGACLLQRPDLFGAAVPSVGVMDMLRFHKFTIGWAWVSEYGSADEPEDFEVLRAYSPLHNIGSGMAYPATLVITADRDDRVVPAHSFKFTAALQAAQKGNAPILIRIETRAGHGAGKPTTKIIEEIADRWAFLTRVLEVESNVPK